MAEERSILYQVPLTERDVMFFRSPDNQPPVGLAQNCVSVSMYLFGIMNWYEARLNAPRVEPVRTEELLSYLNERHDNTLHLTDNCRPITLENLEVIYNILFNGCATFVLATRSNNTGHCFIFYKDPEGTLHLIDAQSHEIYSGLEGIDAYFTETGLNGQFCFVMTPEPGKTHDEYINLYIDYNLSAALGRCSLDGGKRRKHPKRKTRKHKTHKHKTQKKRKTYRR
jgi:hypothetical protein